MNNTSADQIAITIVYARPDSCVERILSVPRGTTAREALSRSEITLQYPEITDANRIGIFGNLIDRDYVLEDRDRIEIYRSLIADPKEARRNRVPPKSKSARI